jgi:hypothetical protein
MDGTIKKITTLNYDFEHTSEKSRNDSHIEGVNYKKELTGSLANSLIQLAILGAEGQNRTADTGIFRPDF